MHNAKGSQKGAAAADSFGTKGSGLPHPVGLGGPVRGPCGARALQTQFSSRNHTLPTVLASQVLWASRSCCNVESHTEPEGLRNPANIT